MNSPLEQIHDAIRHATVHARGQSINRRKARDPTRPAAAWVAPGRIGQDQGKALSIVLSTIGCAHARSDEGGCTMCSYLLDGSSTSPSSEDFYNQFQTAMAKLDGLPAPLSVKIYTSGSFLDESEIPIEARNKILGDLSSDTRIREVVLESRPEYIEESTMMHIRETLGDRIVELGIGLESSNDTVRFLCINKNFDLKSFKESVQSAKNHDIGIRAYVLLKPPFLTEQSALIDAQNTVTDAIFMGVTTISLNPVNVQRNTLVETLWEKGKFRPPWLWSVVEVLRHAHESAKGKVNVVCDPVAAGKIRGTHNCGKCDSAVVEAIRAFSLTQDVHVFDNLDCDCKTLWKHTLEHEDISLVIHK
ncbi:MAG: archaeosine biosynthesis radical SAM protein RaSEA [Candidatus Thorarchaeota archaeon]|nr:archaeosine biosynthesis radical SAM protein RaSEA [Candidatus Thorarchaeota archaeon]